jgi:plastocyanin
MTRRFGLASAAFLAAAALGLAGCGGSDNNQGAAATEGAATTGAATGGETEEAGSGNTIEGYVGPGFDISVEDADNLKAGTYTLKVEDKADIHNFHLTGPGGVDVKTEVSFKGTKTFTVSLQPGEYHFQCDPHSSSMNGTFTVT